MLSATQTLTVLPKEFPTRRLTVNPALVNPPATELARIERESAKTNQIYASPSAQALWAGTFVRAGGRAGQQPLRQPERLQQRHAQLARTRAPTS